MRRAMLLLYLLSGVLCAELYVLCLSHVLLYSIVAHVLDMYK